jgi:predicted dehydrogenase
MALARKLIGEGVIGQLVHFRGQVDEDYQAAEALPWSWRSRLDTGGLGVLGDMTCHLVSLAQELVGPIGSLTADMETVYKTRPVPGSNEMREVENEDVAHALVRFDSGIPGVIMSSRAAHGAFHLAVRTFQTVERHRTHNQ